MSTVTDPRPRPAYDSADDPYRYGWRIRQDAQPDGTVKFTRIPLTLEDVHHPQEEDFIVQRPGHADDCIYLYQVLKVHLGERALVTFDLRIAWDVPEVGALGPDVTVIFGGVYDRDRGTFDVAEEGLRPSVVFEVVSPHTRVNDIGPKIEEYYQGGVEWYVIIDALGFRNGRWDLHVVGYRRGPDHYVAVPLDAAGRLWVEPLRLFVSAPAGRVLCHDAAGELLLDHGAEHAARVEAELAQLVERHLREEAEGELQEAETREADERRQREQAEKLAADQRRQREQAEQREADERRQREQAEQREADERRQREKVEQAKLALEERLRQLEEELRRRGPG